VGTTRKIEKKETRDGGILIALVVPALIPMMAIKHLCNKIKRYLTKRDKHLIRQDWFWSEGWQRAEQEAEKDLAEGRYEDYEDMDEFIESLK